MAPPDAERVEVPDQHSAVSTSATAIATLAPSWGKDLIRKENVSASITIRSTKFTVISRTSCLNCDSRIEQRRERRATARRRPPAGAPASGSRNSASPRSAGTRAATRACFRSRTGSRAPQGAAAPARPTRSAPGAGRRRTGGWSAEANGGRHEPTRPRPDFVDVPAGRRSASSNCNQTVMARAGAIPAVPHGHRDGRLTGRSGRRAQGRRIGGIEKAWSGRQSARPAPRSGRGYRSRPPGRSSPGTCRASAPPPVADR